MLMGEKEESSPELPNIELREKKEGFREVIISRFTIFHYFKNYLSAKLS